MIPRPLSDSARNEYHSGDPGPDHECPDCGGDVYDEDQELCDACR